MSSSAHLALVPRLARMRYAALPPGERKAFEVALHAGTAPALALALRRRPAPKAGALLALSLAPPALAGLVLERPVEQRLGEPRSVALAQIVAGSALLWADRRPVRRARPDARDHLAVGLAQALALVPGVSRAGGALSAARLRGLSRPAATTLALQAALPVTLAAAALKGSRLAREGFARDLRGPAAAGAGAAFLSALASVPLARRLEARHSLAPLAAYRIGLGALALRAAGSRTAGRSA